MGMRWFLIRSKISSFFSRRKKFMSRLYWFCIITIVVLIFAIPIGMGIRNPHVLLPDFHGPPVELIQRWNLIAAQTRREQSRLNDLVVLVNRISENYPYLELVERQNDLDFIGLAVDVFDQLEEVARYEVTPGFFIDFLTEQVLSPLGGLGGLRLTNEPRADGVVPWIVHPYFFGYYDFRFYDDRFDIPVRESNITTTALSENILYLHVASFLPKGYELVTRHPFWYFCFDADKQYLMDVFNNLYGIDELIIDIRGIGSGFRDYFIPLILAPHLHESVSTQFYAFHSDGVFSNRVSYAYRTWYGLGEVAYKNALTQRFVYDLPENVALGFPIEVAIEPSGDAAFGGRIWLLTDSDNFSGPNFAYLQMARYAGFTIVYEETPESIGWATSFSSLPNSGISLRFNPLFFTDATGKSFEEIGAAYDYRLYPDLHELLGVSLP